MRPRSWMVGTLLGCATLVAPAVQAKDAVDTGDVKTLEELHHANLMEEQLGDLATTQAMDKKAQDFGAKMVKEHTNLDKDVTAFAEKRGMRLNDMPELPAAEKTKERQEMQRLKGLTGAEFDKAYMTMMLEDHNKDIQKVTTAISETHNQDLKRLLQHALSVIKDHQRDASHWLQKSGV